MAFAIAGEGLTDYIVLRNLLIGFFRDKNLSVRRLRPIEDEPFGWSNLFNFLPTIEFKNGVEYANFTIVQVDTKECADWNPSIKNIGDETENVSDFINNVKTVLINLIGLDFYEVNQNKILFAITVHDIECWLLPFNSTNKAHQRKMVNCLKTLEDIAQTRGFSINQKNYENGKHYDDFSKEMKDHKELMKKSKLNPSLNYFIETLSSNFPILKQ